MKKPIKAKPQFYALVFEGMKSIAKEYGWNLLIDGSINRDLDLVLVPWVDNHTEPLKVLWAFESYLGGKLERQRGGDTITYVTNGGGRNKAVININRDSRFDLVYGSKDDEYYVDISIFYQSPELMETLKELD